MNHPRKQLFDQLKTGTGSLEVSAVQLLADLQSLFIRFTSKEALAKDLIAGFGSADDADEYLGTALMLIQERVTDIRKYVATASTIAHAMEKGLIRETPAGKVNT